MLEETQSNTIYQFSRRLWAVEEALSLQILRECELLLGAPVCQTHKNWLSLLLVCVTTDCLQKTLVAASSSWVPYRDLLAILG